VENYLSQKAIKRENNDKNDYFFAFTPSPTYVHVTIKE